MVSHAVVPLPHDEGAALKMMAAIPSTLSKEADAIFVSLSGQLCASKLLERFLLSPLRSASREASCEVPLVLVLLLGTASFFQFHKYFALRQVFRSDYLNNNVYIR